MTTTKAALTAAYNAGRAASTEPPERRSLNACPFSLADNPEERAQWLQGLSDAIGEQPSTAELEAALKEAQA